MTEAKKQIRVAFVGNPNCGKTTLFNAVTGSRLKVANWPGVTVEKKEGYAEYEDCSLTIVDTPGIYSLTCYTIEEKVTRQCVMDDAVDVIVNVVDASSLERNLYLTLQLLELGKPVILALNMMDIVEERGWKSTFTDCRKCWAVYRWCPYLRRDGPDWGFCSMQWCIISKKEPQAMFSPMGKKSNTRLPGWK